MVLWLVILGSVCNRATFGRFFPGAVTRVTSAGCSGFLLLSSHDSHDGSFGPRVLQSIRKGSVKSKRINKSLAGADYPYTLENGADYPMPGYSKDEMGPTNVVSHRIVSLCLPPSEDLTLRTYLSKLNTKGKFSTVSLTRQKQVWSNILVWISDLTTKPSRVPCEAPRSRFFSLWKREIQEKCTLSPW